ncbi:MAG: HDOD domain-containing protein [Proteobacteria bacterium]|nr:HDOD domain-containing protein [Pseudomonadota bacterium]
MDTKSKYQSFLIQYHAGVARDLPIISPFARELWRLPRTRTPSIEALTRAFQTDPFLAAKLTGASNSVFFAHDHFIVLTVPEAIRRVGVRYAMNLISEAPPLPPSLDPGEVAVLWAHCMAVADAAKLMAANLPSAPFAPEVAHLVAIIHDIGYLLQISYSPNTWDDILARLEREESHTDNAPHQLQGEELAKFWSLPLAAVEAIKSHHEPNRCSDPHARWLSGIIAISEVLLQRNSEPRQIEADEWSAATMRKELNVSRELLLQVREHALQVHDECMRYAHRPGADGVVPRLQLIRTGGDNDE